MRAVSKRIKKFVALAFVLLWCATFRTGRVGGQHGLEKSPSAEKAQDESMPEGEGRMLLFEVCVQCHDFKNIVSQRKTLAGWRRTVDEMVWRGAPLMGGEADIIANYLATSFGPDKPAAAMGQTASTISEDKDNLQGYLPKAEGRALVLHACVQCHDLRKTVAARKTATGWRRTVKQMVRLGASLNGGDVETMINYLTKSFSPDNPLPAALR